MAKLTAKDLVRFTITVAEANANHIEKDDLKGITEIIPNKKYRIVVSNEFKRDGLIIFNFTTDIESSLFGDEIIITDKEKIIVSGKTMSVLNEEKIMKRLGLGLPFIVMLNKYLIDYNLIDKYILDYKLLGGKLWN